MISFGARRARLSLAILLVGALMMPLNKIGASTPASRSDLAADELVGIQQGYGSTLFKARDGSVGCRRASADETTQIQSRDLHQELRPIEAVQTNAQSGLSIVLRATPALDQNPAAKAAFQRAAQQWQLLIRTQITVVVDVDFGPTWFGQEFPAGAVGLTNPQMLSGDSLYLKVRERLLDNASTQDELSLYYATPQPLVPTDIGDQNTVLGPSALFRALKLIDSVANPDTDPPIWGPPPAIGLNSNVEYDFDGSDGIDPGKSDFESIAAHELGHVLGFESAVGQLEVNPDCVPGFTVWDLFRVRPGVSMSSFDSAQRILHSGGGQVFFNGTDAWALSTGRPDDPNEDEQQPSHWLDDSVSGQRLGVMDPSITPGRRQAITLKDLQALDIMGYALNTIGNSAPSVSRFSADLNGDVLSLTVFGSDPDGDVVQAKLTLLDQKDHVIGETSAFNIDAGIPASIVLTFDTGGLNSSPAAVHVGLTLIDTRNNKSPMAVADFSQGDPGGPQVRSVSYKKGTLKIKGRGLDEEPVLEINGLGILASSGAESGSAKKLSIEASTQVLNLRSGPNRIRVIKNGLRSNIIVFEM